jgi:diadenylate cyclase
VLPRLLETLRSLDGRLIVKSVLDIAIVSYVIYRLILVAKGRRAWWILIGLGVFFLLLLLSDVAGLVTLNWLLRQVTPLGPVAIVILFYPELREVLEKLGRAEFWGAPLHAVHKETIAETIEEVVRAVGLMSPMKTGALIVMERETGLEDVIATGTLLDAEVSSELLGTIFLHGTPLHDGAAVIRGDRIVAAGCTLPLSDSPNVAANVHMRHRAAIGLSENSDAIVIVVSEETGTISLAINGKLQRGLKPETLRLKLLEAFGRNPERRPRSALGFIRRRDEDEAKTPVAKTLGDGAVDA